MEHTIQQIFDLTGRTALLTGGAGHLGCAMAGALAEAGASVILTSREAERAKAQAARLPGLAQHHGIALDHMDSTSIEDGFRQAVAVAGKVDILVNNGNEAVGADWTDVTAEQFNRQLANATGYFLLSRLFREHVVARRVGGSIVMLGSMYGQVASYPDAYEGVCPASPVGYHALKG